MKRLGVLASGGGSNMQAIVESCRSGVLRGHAVPAVVVSNRRKAGALARAEAAGIRTEVSAHRVFESREAHEAAIVEILKAHGVEAIVLAGYMRILTPYFLAHAPGPVINIHPVPTHLYQGAHGYEIMWERRQSLPACYPTVHRVDAGVDTGPVILYGLPFRSADAADLDALRERGLAEEHQLFPAALKALLREEPIPAPRIAPTTGGLMLCDARRRGDAIEGETIYTLRGAGLDGQASLVGPARHCFTGLLETLLRLSRGSSNGTGVQVALRYEDLTITLEDSRERS